MHQLLLQARGGQESGARVRLPVGQDLEHAIVAGSAVARLPDLRRATRAELAQQHVPPARSCPPRSIVPGPVTRQAVRRHGGSGADRQAGLVLVELAQQLPPLRVLLFGRALELQRAALDVHHHGLDFGLETNPRAA